MANRDGIERVQFAAESEMAPAVEAWLTANGASCIGREVEVGFGIPDLVAGIGDARTLRNRRRQAVPVTHALQLAVLDFCRYVKTEQDLRDWAPGGFYELDRRALRPLIQEDLLTLSEGRFRSRANPKDPFDRLIAVELKRSDVGRGMAQAHAYRSFADASYLALPAHRVTPDSMDRARHLGIGLLAVHLGAVEEAVEPGKVSAATKSRRRMASEYTLAAADDGASRDAGSPRPNMMH
jgi:hypothetical protein